jgi:hypothetical protein
MVTQQMKQLKIFMNYLMITKEVNMSKQTALQWFVDKLPHSIETQFSKQIQQAMQMEREQIEEAFNVYGTYAEAEEYFNEIYGGQDE